MITAIGVVSLYENLIGEFNLAMGVNTLQNNTTGSGNTSCGVEGMMTNTTGSYNTTLGYQSNVDSDNLTNATAIGYNAKVSSSNTIQLGNTDVTMINTSAAITANSFNVSGQTGFLKADGTLDNNTYLSKSVGGTMAAAISMGTNPINTSQTTFTSGQLVSKSYVDTSVSTPYLAVLTTQAAFNALATDGYYINMVSGLTGLTGSSLGCAFYRSFSGVCSVTLTYNQLPPSINVYDFTKSAYNCWVKTKSGVGWVVVDQSAYLPLTGNMTMTGPITMGTNAINTTQTIFTSGQLVSKNYVDTATTYTRCTTGDLGLRIIRGNVNANSTITQGSGFTISKSGTGLYNINFTTAFTIVPSIAFAPYGSNQLSGTTNITLTFAQITISNISGVLIDQGFSFIIIGTN
jgi:hypothetical protein